ncbi:MAG: TonB-dependent receptor [Bacteroidaceae bacterium]|nr:TonB-dependent receptor [Bacteroidaceae bacterium]
MSFLSILCLCTSLVAQDSIEVHRHAEDSTDVFYRHLKLNEVTVTGVVGSTKLKYATAPLSLVTAKELRSTASTNIIDAISHQPGISQLTTGGSISKPIIRGLGYNRVVVMSEGVRQEGQQWGDEHGVEVDGSSVGSVEILKGPASLMYGSDAMAGVVILHPLPEPVEDELRANVRSEYQTNNGLFGYHFSLAGNKKDIFWDAAYSEKMAHAYTNKYDGYVPGSQFRERAGRIMLGFNRSKFRSKLTATLYHLTPGIIEGERDPETGGLLCNTEDVKTYGKALPFQQVNHFKVVSDNYMNLSHGSLKAVVSYQQNRRQEFEESADEYELYFKLHTVTYDLRYMTQELNGWKLSAGLGGMFQRSDNLGEEYLIPDYRLFDCGFYATASKTFGQRWTLNGGVRYDHRSMHGDELMEEGQRRFTDFTRDFNGVTGSLGAVCNINEHFNVRLNLARGFRTPNMSELASNGVHEGSIRYEVGAQDLKAEYSLQGDLGLDFTSRYVSAQVALFANRIDNYIFTHRLPQVVEEGYLTYAYTQGDARLLGLEAGVDFHPIHSIHFANTFSYVDAQLLHEPADTKYLPFTPAPRWTSELKWEILHHSHSTITHCHTEPYHHPTHLSFNNLYVAAGLEQYFRQSHIFSADETETTTPAYTLLNLSAGTDVQWQGKKVAELYVTADNVLNTAYQNHLSRLKYADVNTVTGRRGVFNMGRNITIKLIIPINTRL